MHGQACVADRYIRCQDAAKPDAACRCKHKEVHACDAYLLKPLPAHCRFTLFLVLVALLQLVLFNIPHILIVVCWLQPLQMVVEVKVVPRSQLLQLSQPIERKVRTGSDRIHAHVVVRSAVITTHCTSQNPLCMGLLSCASYTSRLMENWFPGRSNIGLQEEQDFVSRKTANGPAQNAAL